MLSYSELLHFLECPAPSTLVFVLVIPPVVVFSDSYQPAMPLNLTPLLSVQLLISA